MLTEKAFKIRNFGITMRNIEVSILILLLPTILQGQVTHPLDKSKLIERNIYPPIVYPDIFIIIDTCRIELDSVSIKLINPNWIRKAEVIKSKKEKNIFSNKNPTVMIYPKRKFKDEILIILNKK
jgi:hypothetical protein